MNILIPHSWLLEYLKTSADPSTIQKLVSLAGPSVERINQIEDEPVYDIEVTTNRVDCMSIKGMAREIAVILERNQIAGSLIEHPLFPIEVMDEKNKLPLPKISDKNKLCKRIMCVVLANVKHTPTPSWMAKRLSQIEQRVHDAVIDITNYVAHEVGHPIHAFDYDKIMALGGLINVVEASAGKKFITLDDKVYETKGGEVVFENTAGEIIDLPAIMGTKNTVVDESTKNILLWIEVLDASSVRRTSMQHAIRSVAAQLNEKNVDPFSALPTMSKAVSLYSQLCQATVASDLYDQFYQPQPNSPIQLSLQKINDYLGLKLSLNEVMQILKNLEFVVTSQEEIITVTPPSFRPDVKIPVDVIEEVARIYGYHLIPSEIMNGVPPTSYPSETNFALEHKIKRVLATLGGQEVYTYSMVSKELALESGYALESHLKIKNPLTDDRTFLRKSLIPSLRELLKKSSFSSQNWIFELANIYEESDHHLPSEKLKLCLVSQNFSVTQLRFILDRSLKECFLKTEIEQNQDNSAVIFATNTEGETQQIGIFSSDSQFLSMELDWSSILKIAGRYPHYQAIPNSAPIIEDLTFSLQPKTKVGDVLASIKAISPLISQIKLIDTYQNRVTLRLVYQDQYKSLTVEEIAPIRLAIVQKVKADHQAELVGSLEGIG